MMVPQMPYASDRAMRLRSDRGVEAGPRSILRAAWLEEEGVEVDPGDGEADGVVDVGSQDHAKNTHRVTECCNSRASGSVSSASMNCGMESGCSQTRATRARAKKYPHDVWRDMK